MRLYLVQHGEAKSEAEDPERPLSDRGVGSVERLARWASQLDLEVGQIRHSGKRRAEQTARILAQRLTPAGGVHAVKGLQPKDDVVPMAATLERETADVMLVGHLPFLARLVGRLVVGDADSDVVRFTNAGIVCLSRAENQWTIEWAVPPQLMTSAGTA